MFDNSPLSNAVVESLLWFSDSFLAFWKDLIIPSKRKHRPDDLIITSEENSYLPLKAIFNKGGLLKI